MSEKKALIVFADGFEEIEALTPVDILRRAGIDVTTASISDSREVRGARGVTVITDRLLSECADSHDALVLPGGPGTASLRTCDTLLNRVREQYESGRLCCAICAAPTVLTAAGLPADIPYTCYPGADADMNMSGSTGARVEIAENVITSKGPGTAVEFALAVTEALADKETAKTVGDQIIFNQ
ncbi:MAG: DJ-1 family glyoxalase III [Fibrobacterota bacterium]